MSSSLRTSCRRAQSSTGLSPYTPDQAADSLSQLAQLHVVGWRHTGLGAMQWLAPRLGSYLLSQE